MRQRNAKLRDDCFLASSAHLHSARVIVTRLRCFQNFLELIWREKWRVNRSRYCIIGEITRLFCHFFHFFQNTLFCTLRIILKSTYFTAILKSITRTYFSSQLYRLREVLVITYYSSLKSTKLKYSRLSVRSLMCLWCSFCESR